jgi:hypothetical protein
VTRFYLSFLALDATQAAYSVKGFVGRLREVFPAPPAVSALICGILDAASRFFQRRPGNIRIVVPHLADVTTVPLAGPLAWLWVVMEFLNGTGHLGAWKYKPGVATAPFLLFLAFYLARSCGAPVPYRSHRP